MADLAFDVAGNLLGKLGSLAYEEISSAWGMKDDLKKLQKTTAILKDVLLDAEKKQEQNERLRIWLGQLTDVLHDAQDVLDEFECEVLRSEVVKEYGNLGRKVRRFFSRSNPVAFRFSIAHQIKEIRKNLDEIAEEMNKFQLISNQINQEPRLLMQGTREMTHSHVKASEVIGRDVDKEKIVGMLINEDHSVDNLSVMPIVGIGGLGKTALAKSVYNDERVIDWFGLRMWVCLPLDLNVTESVREILKSAISATSTTTDGNFSMDHSLKKTKAIGNLSLDQLQMFLRSILKEKRFLLILDDVWSEDSSKWNEMREILTVGAKDSKIVVTTRNNSVASIMGTTVPYELQGLAEEASLSLFLKFAFGDDQLAEQFSELKDIGRQIVEKCKGVPLAVKTLGSLLYLETDESEWIRVRDNEIWKLNQEHNDRILSVLRLSYSSMPSYLKQCFPYCSVVPKGTKLQSLDLIWIWMALGTLQSPGGKMELEDIGKLYFKEFCARSFFQYLNEDDDYEYGYVQFLTQRCQMHDLIYDLAITIIKDKLSIVSSHTRNIHENVRYLTIWLNDEDCQSVFKIKQKLKKVRSIILKNDEDHEKQKVVEFIFSCISRFKKLQVLDLSDSSSSSEALPNSIGALKHLRYLSLTENKKIKKLPDSICKLQSLQTLLLAGCMELQELPKDIRNLVSLRNLSVTTKQECLPENRVGCLKSLRFLYVHYCSNLRSLPYDLRYCTTLRILIIEGCEQLDLASGAIDEDVQSNLQTLAITNLPRTTALPDWLQGAAKTLQNLYIKDCPELGALPAWLPNLTSLQRLVILDCPQLLSWPEGMQHLKSLKHLKIKGCEALEESFKRQVATAGQKYDVSNIIIGDETHD